MKINCNHHIESFCREDAINNEYHPLTNVPLELDGDYWFLYRYPLSVKVAIPHLFTSQQSSIDILMLAKKDYQDIYAAEDAAVGKTENIPGMLNRDTSAGPYGIWGHCLSDLYFETIHIDNAEKIISFDIGS